MMEKIAGTLSYAFAQYALIVGVLIALCAALLGVTLVLKRFSYIGDGLSHVAFGAMAVASALKLTDNMMLVLPLTMLTAILLLRTGQHTKIKGDAAIAMISVGALALGYLLMNLFKSGSNVAGDVCSTLFGSTNIITLKLKDVWFCAAMAAVVVGVYAVFYHRIFAVTFDEDFSRAVGVHAEAYNLLIAVIIALVIVMGMKMVGSLLISALVIFPAMSAMRLFRSFRAVTLFSAGLSVFCAVIGILIHILINTPVGATIVAVNVAAFVICGLAGLIRGRA